MIIGRRSDAGLYHSVSISSRAISRRLGTALMRLLAADNTDGAAEVEDGAD